MAANNKKQNPDISARSTKQEILDAYNKVLKQLDDQGNMGLQQEKETKENIELVDRAVKSNSNENIIEELVKLKLNINQELNKLSEKIFSEFSRLETIRKAINLEQKHLGELYGIKETANSFAALISAHDKKKKELEDEIEKETLFWHKKKGNLAEEFDSSKQALEKQRKHEEEEYKYNTELERCREKDAYEMKKTVKEKELFDRENILASREEEFKRLQKEALGFDEKLQKAISEAKETTTRELALKYEFESKLREKEIEGDIRLKEQRISSLEGKIMEQESLISQLSDKANKASSQVQDIANRALDTSSQRIFYPFSEKSQANQIEKKSA